MITVIKTLIVDNDDNNNYVFILNHQLLVFIIKNKI